MSWFPDDTLAEDDINSPAGRMRFLASRGGINTNAPATQPNNAPQLDPYRPYRPDAGYDMPAGWDTRPVRWDDQIALTGGQTVSNWAANAVRLFSQASPEPEVFDQTSADLRQYARDLPAKMDLNPHAANPSAQFFRGLTPGAINTAVGAINPVLGAQMLFGGQYEQSYGAKEQELMQSGAPSDQVKQGASDYAMGEMTSPQNIASNAMFLLAPRIVPPLVRGVAPMASPLVRAGVSGVANLGANLFTSGILRRAQGEDFFPNSEQAGTDTGFALGGAQHAYESTQHAQSILSGEHPDMKAAATAAVNAQSPKQYRNILRSMDAMQEQARTILGRSQPVAPELPHHEAVAEAGNKLGDLSNDVNVQTVRNESEITDPELLQHIKDNPGIHEGLTRHNRDGTSDVVLISDNISPDRIDKVPIHEIVGHFGVNKILPEGAWNGITASALTGDTPLRSKVIRQYFDGKEPSTAQQVDTFGREYVARLSEDTNLDPTVWQRFTGAMRAGLRAINPNGNWSDSELKDLVRNAYRRLPENIGDNSIQPITLGANQEDKDRDPLSSKGSFLEQGLDRHNAQTGEGLTLDQYKERLRGAMNKPKFADAVQEIANSLTETARFHSSDKIWIKPIFEEAQKRGLVKDRAEFDQKLLGARGQLEVTRADFNPAYLRDEPGAREMQDGSRVNEGTEDYHFVQRNQGKRILASLTPEDQLRREFAGAHPAVMEGDNPRDFFHGTSHTQELADHGFFDTSKANPKSLYGPGAAYFTSDPEIAGGDGGKIKGYQQKGEGDSHGIVPAHVKLKNPLNMDSETSSGDSLFHGFFHENERGRLVGGGEILDKLTKKHPEFDWDYLLERMERAADNENITNGDIYQNIAKTRDENGKAFGKERLNQFIRDDLGHDGMIHTGGDITGSKPHQVAIAFYPSQIFGKYGGIERKAENRMLFSYADPEKRLLSKRPSEEAAREMPSPELLDRIQHLENQVGNKVFNHLPPDELGNPQNVADWVSEFEREIGHRLSPQEYHNTLEGVLKNGLPKKKIGGPLGITRGDDVQSIMSSYADAAQRNLKDRAVTKPVEPTPEERRKVEDAYRQKARESGFPAVSIADVMEGAGIPLDRAPGIAHAMYRAGQITSLSSGDWSLADQRKQAFGVRNLPGMDTPALMMRMPEGGQRILASLKDAGPLGRLLNEKARKVEEGEPSIPGRIGRFFERNMNAGRNENVTLAQERGKGERQFLLKRSEGVMNELAGTKDPVKRKAILTYVASDKSPAEEARLAMVVGGGSALIGTAHRTAELIADLQAIQETAAGTKERRDLFDSSSGKYLRQTYEAVMNPKRWAKQLKDNPKLIDDYVDSIGRMLPKFDRDIIEKAVKQYAASWQRGGGEQWFDQATSSKIPSDLVRSLKDLTPEHKAFLGEYSEPRQRIGATLHHLLSGTAQAVAINELSRMAAGRKVGIKDEANWSSELKAARAKGDKAEEARLSEMLKVPDSEAFGKLRNQYVEPDVWDALNVTNQMVAAPGGWGEKALNLNRLATQVFKFNKIILDWGAHGKQWAQTPLLAMSAGVMPWEIGPFGKIHAMRNDPKMIAEMQRNHITGADYSSQDLHRDATTLDLVFNPTKWEKFEGGIKAVGEVAARWYGKPDNLLRATAYVKKKAELLKSGMSEQEAQDAATNHVNKWTMNFGNVPAAVKAARNMAVPFSPFISYGYEMGRILKNHAIEVLPGSGATPKQRAGSAAFIAAMLGAPLLAAWAGYNRLSKKGKKDWDQAQAAAPDYSKGQVRAPIREEKDGSISFMNLGNLTPAGDYAAMVRNLANGDIMAVLKNNPFLGFDKNPVLNTWADIRMGENKNTHAPIDDAGDVFKAAAATMLPSWFPILGTESKNIHDAFTRNDRGELGVMNERTGRQNNPWTFASNFLGARVGFLNADAARRSLNGQRTELVDQHKMQLKRIFGTDARREDQDRDADAEDKQFFKKLDELEKKIR